MTSETHLLRHESSLLHLVELDSKTQLDPIEKSLGPQHQRCQTQNQDQELTPHFSHPVLLTASL